MEKERIIIDHKQQLENGKDKEEYWVHMIIGMIKSKFPNMFKNRKPIITKKNNLIEISGINSYKEIKLEREIKVDNKTYKYNILLNPVIRTLVENHAHLQTLKEVYP